MQTLQMVFDDNLSIEQVLPLRFATRATHIQVTDKDGNVKVLKKR